MRHILKAFVILYSFFCGITSVAHAQGKFKIGEPIPDFTLDTIINFEKAKTSIGAFKGKHLIIDFWGTFCIPCIADIPKMEKLQEQYKDQLYILMVGGDGVERAKNFYAIRKRNNKPMKLASAHNRTVINYFGIREVPQYAWIDNNGIVRALTEGRELTEKNITAFLSGKDFNPRMSIARAETIRSFNGKTLVNYAAEKDSTNIMYSSAITRYLPGVAGSFRYPKDDNATQIGVRNSPIAMLYRLAYADSGQTAIIYSMCEVDGDEEEGFITMPKDADFESWRVNNTYCYELTVPPGKGRQLRDMMKQDLNRFFDVDARFEMRKKEVYVLVSEKTPVFMTNNATPKYTLHGAGGATIVNQPFKRFFDLIWHHHQTKILINEAGITGNIDMDFRAEMTDIDSLNIELAKFGLRLKKETRDVRMLVLRRRR